MKRRDLLAAVGAGAVAGCLGGVSEGELTGDMDEDEFDAFIDDVDEAMDEIGTFRSTLEAVSTAGGQTVQIEVVGRANHTAQEAYIEVDMSLPAGAVPPGQATTFAMYVEGSTAYVDDGMDGDWVKGEPEQFTQFWDNDLFIADDPLYQYGAVHVDVGVEVITVTTELDGDQLDAAEDEMDDELQTQFEDIDFDEYTAVERFDAETYYLTEIVTEGVGEMNDQDVEMEEWREITNINEDLDTSVPDEVRENASASRT